MNTINPAAVPGEFAPSRLPAKTIPEPPVRLPRLLLGLVLAVGTFDLCFWGATGLGFSLGLFALVLAGIILGNRDFPLGDRMTGILLALLTGAAFATVIEAGVTNTIVLIMLIVALAGHSFFTGADSFWGRWLSQGIALLFAPGRVFWLGARLTESAFKGGFGSATGLIGGFLLVIPAVVLALVFGSLLASGNAVFGAWTSNFFDWLWNELALYLNAWRIFLWFLAAFLILPLLRPTLVSEWWWRWTERMPRLPEIIPSSGAFFSSGLILAVLNILFFIANIADALFLWSGQALPVGVTYSSFVHNGVNSLIVTVILSAFVLTAIFQQALNVSQRRELKALAILWIAQNLFLLLSVALRLKLYIEAFDMTVARLSVMIFLALVAVGYALLTVKIIRDRSLSWLIGGCVLAVFATFYMTQFLDLAGWSANYNVARWEKDRSRNLDFAYLIRLGPPAWPARRHAEELDPSVRGAWQKAGRLYTRDERGLTQAEFDTIHWREFSLRAWLNRWALDDKK